DEKARVLRSGGYCDRRRPRRRRVDAERRLAEPADDGIRGGRVRRLPRRDRPARVPARVARFAMVRHQREEGLSRRCSRVVSAGSATTSVIPKGGHVWLFASRVAARAARRARVATIPGGWTSCTKAFATAYRLTISRSRAGRKRQSYPGRRQKKPG